MLCLKVPKSKGEKVKNKLLDKDLLNKSFKFDSDDDFIYIPLKQGVEVDNIFDLPVVEKKLERRPNYTRDYTDILDLPKHLRDKLPSSFDIIGDIVLLKIPDDLTEYKKDIGKAILETHKNATTVLEDKGVTGRHRIREVDYIAGENKAETIHREYGAEFEVDVSKVYFSPRLATERWRVVKNTKEDDIVLDMFTGVGPYSILIAKNVAVKTIFSIDINPYAIKYLVKNIKRNNVENLIEVYEGDAREIVKNLTANRIIMNLPHSSFGFLKDALQACDDKTTFHYYEILDCDIIDERKEQIRKTCEDHGFYFTFGRWREVRTYSASEKHISFDFTVKK